MKIWIYGIAFNTVKLHLEAFQMIYALKLTVKMLDEDA